MTLLTYYFVVGYSLLLVFLAIRTGTGSRQICAPADNKRHLSVPKFALATITVLAVPVAGIWFLDSGTYPTQYTREVLWPGWIVSFRGVPRWLFSELTANRLAAVIAIPSVIVAAGAWQTMRCHAGAVWRVMGVGLEWIERATVIGTVLTLDLVSFVILVTLMSLYYGHDRLVWSARNTPVWWLVVFGLSGSALWFAMLLSRVSNCIDKVGARTAKPISRYIRLALLGAVVNVPWLAFALLAPENSESLTQVQIGGNRWMLVHEPWTQMHYLMLVVVRPIVMGLCASLVLSGWRRRLLAPVVAPILYVVSFLFGNYTEALLRVFDFWDYRSVDGYELAFVVMMVITNISFSVLCIIVFAASGASGARKAPEPVMPLPTMTV